MDNNDMKNTRQSIQDLVIDSSGKYLPEGVFSTLLQNFETSYEESLE